jgi:drug/metabolite transporter (DMT)-like permease
MRRLAALAAVIFWGVSFVATKQALQQLSPVLLIFTRFGLGLLVLVVILRIRREPLLPPVRHLPALALMGFIGIFVHQMLQVHGLALTTAIRTGWLIGMIPIWSAIIAAIVLGERLSRTRLAGLLVGTVGAIVVITRGDFSTATLSLPTTKGDLLILASTLNWAVYGVVGRKTLQTLGSTRATAGAMFIGWLMLVPLLLISQPPIPAVSSLSTATIVAVLFLGLGCSGLAYLFWYAALEKLSTAQVAAFLHIEPVITLIAAVLLLNESVAVTTVVGGLLVLIGVVIVQRVPSPPISVATVPNESS